jgi:NarL family two-component system response regulator LiaR
MPNSVNTKALTEHTQMSHEQLSILIVDDSEVIRLGIAAAMQKEPTFNVIGSVSLLETTPEEICQMQPDVVLLETASSDGSVELIKVLREVHPKAKIMALTMDETEQGIRNAFESGVDGYCTKGVRMDFLITGIKTIAAGGRWASPKVVELLLSATKVVQSEARFAAKSKAHGTLSAREQQVLDLLVQGYSNTEIGARLYLSPETIKTHVRHIMEKLSVRDRTHAAVEAVRRGLVSAAS